MQAVFDFLSANPDYVFAYLAVGILFFFDIALANMDDLKKVIPRPFLWASAVIVGTIVTFLWPVALVRRRIRHWRAVSNNLEPAYRVPQTPIETTILVILVAAFGIAAVAFTIEVLSSHI